MAEKLVTFLNNTPEFQGLTVDQKAIIVTRNVPTVIRFMSMTVEWIGEGEDQIIFLRRLLTSFSGTDVFLKYIKPERFSFKTAHAKHGNVFISDEHEKEFDEVMKNLQQFESLTIFDAGLSPLHISAFFFTSLTPRCEIHIQEVALESR